jgi:hypothetical protein
VQSPAALCEAISGVSSSDRLRLLRQLPRRDRRVPLGKESNSLEEVEAGMIQSADNVYTEYPGLRRDEECVYFYP